MKKLLVCILGLSLCLPIVGSAANIDCNDGTAQGRGFNVNITNNCAKDQQVTLWIGGVSDCAYYNGQPINKLFSMNSGVNNNAFSALIAGKGIGQNMCTYSLQSWGAEACQLGAGTNSLKLKNGVCVANVTFSGGGVTCNCSVDG